MTLTFELTRIIIAYEHRTAASWCKQLLPIEIAGVLQARSRVFGESPGDERVDQAF